MEPLEPPIEESADRPPLWVRAGSLLLLLFASTLLVLAVSFGRAPQSTTLLVPIFAALCCAAGLQIRYLLSERRQFRRTAKAFYATDREYRSIFQHVLDAILILNDQGTCLDANPSAFALLRLPRAALVGHNFARFYANQVSFSRDWGLFLDQKYQRGEAELVRGDRSTVYASYTAAANYLPGRHVIILCDTTEKRQAERSLLESEERFRQMAENIQEIFWMMNAGTKEVIYVNPAYEVITGQSIEHLYKNRLSYLEIIHPNDRASVLAKLEDAAHSGKFDEEFRILRTDGALRWVWVKAFPVRDARGPIHSLVGTVQDITKRKHAEAQIAGHLATAEAARAEAEALRKSTLALTQNLSMDIVLDTLLESLAEIVPYGSASVILTEADSRLFVAREAPRPTKKETLTVLDAKDNIFLERALLTQKNVLLVDTAEEPEWREIKVLVGFRSWMCVPLVASDHVLGLLSVGHIEPQSFTPEHLRRTRSLAIAAAVAIQNARLYERAEFYSAALEVRLKEVPEARN